MESGRKKEKKNQRRNRKKRSVLRKSIPFFTKVVVARRGRRLSPQDQDAGDAGEGDVVDDDAAEVYPVLRCRYRHDYDPCWHPQSSSRTAGPPTAVVEVDPSPLAKSSTDRSGLRDTWGGRGGTKGSDGNAGSGYPSGAGTTSHEEKDTPHQTRPTAGASSIPRWRPYRACRSRLEGT